MPCSTTYEKTRLCYETYRNLARAVPHVRRLDLEVAMRPLIVWIIVGWVVFVVFIVAALRWYAKGRDEDDLMSEAHMVQLEAEDITLDAAPPEIYRPNWDEYFLLIAQAVASRGECTRSQVGAVIVRDKRIISTGYNGVAAGDPSCLDGICPRARNNVPRGVPYEGDGACVATHAEDNAIHDAMRRQIAVFGSTIYLTKEPCEKCVSLLAALEMTAVFLPKSRHG